MFVIDCPYLDLKQIYYSGQVYRWKRITDSKYIIFHKDKAVKVTQNKNKLIFSCSMEDFYDIWFDYFDMKTDYENINHKISISDEDLKDIADGNSGIRLLKQDLYETIIVSIFKFVYGTFRTKQMIEKLCLFCGKSKINSFSENGSFKWNVFPSPDRILKNKDIIEGEFEAVANNVISVCEAIQDGWLDLNVLSSMDYKNAYCYISDVLDERCVEYVCIHALHFTNIFPYILDSKFIEYLKNNLFGVSEDGISFFYEWYLTGVEEKAILYCYLYSEYFKPKGDFKWVW